MLKLLRSTKVCKTLDPWKCCSCCHKSWPSVRYFHLLTAYNIPIKSKEHRSLHYAVYFQPIRECSRFPPSSPDFLRRRRSLPRNSKKCPNFNCLPNIALRSYTTTMESASEVFQGYPDRFDGVIVDSKAEYTENVDFTEKLRKSLENWGQGKRRGIWFKVHTDQANWVPILTQFGFIFHHVENGCVAMYLWLPKDQVANVPPYAHTMVGVGGVVINDKNEILVVTDHYALIKDSWKLPGGYVDPRENYVEAAIREVEEETGVISEFDTVISFRHSHGGNFGCSDIYMVIALKPKTLELKPDDREIARVAWMPVSEYITHPHVHETNRLFVKTYFDYKRRGIHFRRDEGIHQVLKKPFNLYYISLAQEQQQQEEEDDCKKV